MKPLLFEYLSKADIDWAFCGGIAIDIFVGHQTRNHKDLDIAVFWDQRTQLLEYLLNSGCWRIFEPENGLLREITCLENDFMRNDNLWCISRDSTAYRIELMHDNFYDITTTRKHQDSLDFIEFLFNKRIGNEFLYKRDNTIRHTDPILSDPFGYPYLSPEIVLLYKSVFVRYLNSTLPSDVDMVNDYRHDFDAAFPLLDALQKDWLKVTLATVYPEGHEWD